jgi:hypothetical protein
MSRSLSRRLRRLTWEGEHIERAVNQSAHSPTVEKWPGMTDSRVITTMRKPPSRITRAMQPKLTFFCSSFRALPVHQY